VEISTRRKNKKMPKIINKRIVLVFITLFSFLNLLSCNHESQYDGNDSIGFPFVFFTIHGGKRFDDLGNKLDVINLLIDIGIIWIAAMLLINLIKLYKKRK
jgi:hypothetical protein